MIRSCFALTAIVMILGACGGGSGEKAAAPAQADVGLSGKDKVTAEQFWSDKSPMEQQALCEELATATGRLDAARSLEMQFLMEDVGKDVAENSSDAADNIAEREKRAEAIVTNIAGRC